MLARPERQQTTDAEGRAPSLVIERIDGRHIDLSAHGSFRSCDATMVAGRLRRIGVGGARLRIDCRDVTGLHPDVRVALTASADLVRVNGGSLDIIGVEQ